MTISQNSKSKTGQENPCLQNESQLDLKIERTK